jgi:hypothetical protein
VFATRHDVCSIDFTYNFNMNCFSFIEHFVVSTTVFELFFDSCPARHDGDNLSDHDPITLSIVIDWSSIDTSSRQYVRKCSWHKASDSTLYKRHLKVTLDTLYIPVERLVRLLVIMSCAKMRLNLRLRMTIQMH